MARLQMAAQSRDFINDTPFVSAKLSFKRKQFKRRDLRAKFTGGIFLRGPFNDLCNGRMKKYIDVLLFIFA
jgi:hypothetical protein